ncbi:MAG: hypothetical protein ACRDWY_01880 [Actinomycetes bacterium]
MRSWVRIGVTALFVGVLPVPVAAAMPLSGWGATQKVDEIPGNSSELNTAAVDGCPIQAPNGLSLYLASNRPGGLGGLDIWVARRASRDVPFGAPENLGTPVNSAADDFCPTPVRGNGLYFVSRRTTTESCGLGDIYRTRFNRVHGWREPEQLACAPAGPNTALDEQGPSLVKVDETTLLYFSSSSPSVPGDIFVSERGADGRFGPASPVAELNGSANDIQPNVRKDGREIVFSSNRTGSQGQDIWASTRDDVDDPWSPPTNLGGAVNTEAAETRPSLSWDARTLYFGRAPGPEGGSDIYRATRQKFDDSDDDDSDADDSDADDSDDDDSHDDDSHDDD